MPNKRGTIVIKIESNALIPSRTMTGWRICIDYQKLNKKTRKDQFRLPFMDQMLDRLARHEYYCFLYGYLGYNFNAPKIPKNFYNNFIIYFGYELSQTWIFPGKIDKSINCEM